MDSRKDSKPDYPVFLDNDKFIQWRLTRTDELNRYWDDYLRENPDKKDELLLAIGIFSAIKLNKELLPANDRVLLRMKIEKQLRTNKTMRIRFWSYTAVACMIILITVSGLFLYQRHFDTTEMLLAIVPKEEVVGEALPDTDIQLITGNEVISLENDAAIRLGLDGKLVVVENEKNVLTKEKLPDNRLNKLVVPSGKRTTLLLADGTKVWLNSGSEIEFPSVFMEDKRIIKVKGEVFIDVKKNDDVPFLVQTPRFGVRVHGTSFNISAYEDANDQSVVLVDGKIEISGENIPSTFLAPSEMLSINPGVVSKTSVVVEEYISWKEGILVFNRTPISEVLKKIGRYYNVVFENNGASLLSKTCTGKLYLSENLDDVMESLSALSSITYRRENELIYLNQKQMPMVK